MTPEQQTLKSHIAQAMRVKNQADRQYYFLVSNCTHEFIKDESEAIKCTICDQWGCPDDVKE